MKRKADLDLLAQLQTENLDLAKKLRLAENKVNCSEQAVIETKDEIKSQNLIIREV